MRYKILAVLALLVALAAPVAAQDDSYIIRADQIKGGTLGPSVTIDPDTLPANVLTTGEVLAAGAAVVTDNGDGTITVETPTKAADASLLNGAAESTAADANTIAKRDANADLAVRRIVSALATGTSPFSILSTTLNANLNADLLDGQHATAFLGVSEKAADSSLLNGAADATAATASTIAKRDASADLTARRFISSIATGTSPLSVISTTLNANLNADLLDGLEASAFSLTSHLHTGVYLPVGTAISVPSYTSTIASGTQPYACTSTTLNLNLNADLLDGNHASAFLGVSEKAADSSLLNGAADATGATANTIAKRDASGDLTSRRFLSTATTGTSPFSILSTTLNLNLNADLLDGYTAGNASGNIPVSNGTLNTNLNADTLDGNHATAFLGATATAADSTKINGYTLDTTNTTAAANAYYYFDGATSSIKRKALVEVQAEIGGGGGGDYVSKTGDTMTGPLVTPAVLLQSTTVPTGNKISHYPEEAAGASWANAAGFGTSAGQSGATASYDASTSTWYYNHNMSVTVPRFYKSTDGGASWTGVTTLDAYHAGAGSCGDVLAIGNGVLIAGLTNWNEIYRSTDSGATWALVYDGPDAVPYLGAAATDGAGTVIFTTGNGGGIHRSTDYGATWTLINGIFTSTVYYDIEYANGVWITCGNAGNAYRSTNGGQSWSLTPISSGQAVGIAYAGGNNWVACSYANLNRWYRSTDNGASWTVGPANAVVRYLFCVDVDAARTRIRAVGQNQSLAYAVFTSTDGGATFTQEALTAPNNVARIFYSGYNGGRWVTGFATSPYIQYFAPNILDFVKIDGSDGGVIMTGIPSATSTALHINTVSGKVSYSASSLRFKDDVAPFVLDWDRFLALEPLTFTEKATGEKGKLGFAAEWTAPLYPGEVPLDAEGKPFSVDYERLVVPAVAAIKEIKHERDADAGEIRALRAENADLRRRLEAIEAVVGAGR